MSTLDAVRVACAEVTRRARSVHIDDARLLELSRTLLSAPSSPPALDPAHHHRGDASATLAYVLTLDAINFGSGWFPLLRKRPGLSGYFTLATSLAEQFDRHGAFRAAELRALSAADCARILGQQQAPAPVAELMALFARALADLGAFLEERFDGRFEGPIEEAAGCAARLVALLAEMPLYRDVSRYDELEVPFYKRAQLTAADLAAAFEERGPGRFEDLGELTIFADNLVPHVLRREGVLVYEAGLAARVDAETLIAAGSPEEVEIRAVAVEAVERCVALLREAGRPTTAQALDHMLWNRGQLPEMKAHPRHRTRTPYY